LYGICYRLADSIVAVTDGIREYLNERYPTTRAKTFVTSNGANIEISRPLEKIDACGELGLDPDRTYLVFVGSLKKWHGVENAISVAERLIENNDGIRLLVLGDGPERPFLRNVVAEKGLEKRVTFLGKVKYDQVPLYIGTATACLALYNRKSNDRSGLRPLKIFEYMACGRPVVTTDVGNLRSVIGKHKCGLIVEPGDLDAMSEAVMNLVRDPNLARELGENGRKAAVRYYSWRAISEELQSILHAAVNKI
jgi:glycosyltransferase involved in cell wall biosynthesis